MSDRGDTSRILRLAEALTRTGLKRSTLYKLSAAGAFPPRVAITARSVGWYEHEVATWIASRPRAGQTIRADG